MCAKFGIPHGDKVQFKDLLGEKCSEKYVPKCVVGNGDCFFRSVFFYLLTGSECKHDIIWGCIIVYILSPVNWDMLAQYILPSYNNGMAYIAGKLKAKQGEWVTEVEIFACTQIMGKAIVVYMPNGWQRYTD